MNASIPCWWPCSHSFTLPTYEVPVLALHTGDVVQRGHGLPLGIVSHVGMTSQRSIVGNHRLVALHFFNTDGSSYNEHDTVMVLGVAKAEQQFPPLHPPAPAVDAHLEADYDDRNGD